MFVMLGSLEQKKIIAQTWFERLRDDIASFPMWWKNGVARVFLIFFFANVGSAIGTYIAGASIIKKIFA